MSRISKEKRNEYQNKYRRKIAKKARGYVEITTESLEELALELINKDHTDKTAINMLLEIWKYKHRIPDSKKEDIKIDFGAIVNG